MAYTTAFKIWLFSKTTYYCFIAMIVSTWDQFCQLQLREHIDKFFVVLYNIESAQSLKAGLVLPCLTQHSAIITCDDVAITNIYKYFQLILFIWWTFIRQRRHAGLETYNKLIIDTRLILLYTRCPFRQQKTHQWL